MANCCSFTMRISGNNLDNIEQAIDNLPRLYDYNIIYHDDYIEVYGDCKWSVASSFQNSLEELSKGRLIEVYAEECGLCFAEHYIYVNGKCDLEKVVDYYEFTVGTPYEDFIEYTKINMSEEAYNKHFETEEVLTIGGFDYKFSTLEDYKEELC